MRLVLIRSALVLLCLCCLWLTRQASSADPGLNDTVCDNYPGRDPLSGGVLQYAGVYLQRGILSYFKVYGKWPDKWSDVVAAGLFSGKLLALGGQTINPDDPKLDFLDDYYYDKRDGQGRALVLVLGGLGQPKMHYLWLEPPQTYKRRIARYAETEGSNELVHFQNDEAALLQYGQLAMLEAAISTYRQLHHHYPASIAELEQSGLSPFDGPMVNPVTGKPYKFDASPGDVDYRVIKRSGKPDAYFLQHVLLTGEYPTERISY